MAKIQKLIIFILFFIIVSCGENAEALKCANEGNSFYQPPIENYLGDSIAAFDVRYSKALQFRLDGKQCRKDSCSYYIFNLSTFGIHDDSMMSLRYYSRVKKWNMEDVIINCDFVQKFEANDQTSSGYFKFSDNGICPVLIKKQMDSCSYQKAVLHIDSTISFERVF